MKATFLLCVLASLAFNSEAAIARVPAARANLSLGYISAGDRLLTRQVLHKNPIPNTIQSQDLIYRGNSTTRISAIQAFEMGYTQNASAWLLSGGIGRSNATMRFQSARGYGYYYQVDIWGKL